jgi:hypothetical protein
MTNAVYSLRETNIGVETVIGTPVAATRRFIGALELRPIVNREEEGYPTGVRMASIGEDITTWRGAELDFECTLDTEQLLYPLLSGIASVTPTGTGPYTWVFPATVVGAAVTVKGLTVEAVYTDGSNVRHKVRVSGALTSSIEIELTGRSRAILRWSMFADAANITFTPTAGMVAIPGRDPLAALQFGVAIDDTWLTLGDTPKSGLVRAGTLTIETGLQPDWTLEGDQGLGSSQHVVQRFSASWASTMELNADATTEKDAWFEEPPTPRFVEVFYNNGEATTANRQIIMDFAGVYSEQPDFDNDGEVELLTATLGVRYDPTSTEALTITVINGLATFT